MVILWIKSLANSCLPKYFYWVKLGKVELEGDALPVVVGVCQEGLLHLACHDYRKIYFQHILKQSKRKT